MRSPRVNNIDLGRLGLRPGARVLDLGCARGDQSIMLAQHGFDVVGADVDPALLEILERSATERGVRVAAWRLDVQDGLPEAGSFDAVVCTEVLEHVPDYRRAMQQIVRALRPGGRACISVPTARTELVFQRLHRQYVPLSTHVNVLPRPLLLSELRRAGLVIEHTESRNFEWTLFWLLHCAARSRFDHTGRPLEHDAITRFYHRLRGAFRKARLDRPLMRAGDRVLPKSLYVYARRPSEPESTVFDVHRPGEGVEHGAVAT
jgi:SAM-dependent methyltransferase